MGQDLSKQLSYAAARGEVRKINELLSQGADVNGKDKYGWTPLTRAARNGHRAAIRCLVERGADLEAKNGMGEFMQERLFQQRELAALAVPGEKERRLQRAVADGDLAKISEIISIGADVNAKDSDGWTVLRRAAYNEQVAVIMRLIKCGADIEAKDKFGDTALMCAARKGHATAVQCLLEHGADIDATNNIGYTALNEAAFSGHIVTIECLLASGANIEGKSTSGMTVLMHAACNGHVAAIACLIRRGAQIEARRRNGITALGCAAKEGHLPAIQCLIECGADIDSKTKDGQDAIQIAATNNHAELVDYMSRIKQQRRLALGTAVAPQAAAVSPTGSQPASDEPQAPHRPAKNQRSPSAVRRNPHGASRSPMPHPTPPYAVFPHANRSDSLSVTNNQNTNRFLLNAIDVTTTTHIGDGGQASVYQGTWFGVQVAVKMFAFGSNSKKLAKMKREIDREMAALTRLRHPHIVQMYGYYQEPTKTGLVMEYCGDGDLSEYCIDRPLTEKLVLTMQVLEALRYLHVQEVVHGDVKPQNVLIQDGKAKLADFAMSSGAVVSASKSMTTHSKATVTGTTAYSSPEVLEGGRRALSSASDMYSAGMLVFHLVEEEMPWCREGDLFIMQQIKAGELPPFESENWTPELVIFVRGCCDADPASRYDAPEALQRLAGVLRKLPMVQTEQQSMERMMREMAVTVMSGPEPLIGQGESTDVL